MSVSYDTLLKASFYKGDFSLFADVYAVSLEDLKDFQKGYFNLDRLQELNKKKENSNQEESSDEDFSF